MQLKYYINPKLIQMRNLQRKSVKIFKYMKARLKSAYFLTRKRWVISYNLQDLVTNFLANDFEYHVVLDFVKHQPYLTYTSPSSVNDIIESIAFAF